MYHKSLIHYVNSTSLVLKRIQDRISYLYYEIFFSWLGSELGKL